MDLDELSGASSMWSTASNDAAAAKACLLASTLASTMAAQAVPCMDLSPRRLLSAPSLNLLKRLQDRALQPHRPGRCMLDNRRFYTNLFPNCTSFKVTQPEFVIRKFTPCGQYLVCFSQNAHALRIYHYHMPHNSTINTLSSEISSSSTESVYHTDTPPTAIPPASASVEASGSSSAPSPAPYVTRPFLSTAATHIDHTHSSSTSSTSISDTDPHLRSTHTKSGMPAIPAYPCSNRKLEFDAVFKLKYEKILTGGSEMLCKDFCLFAPNKRHMILSSAVPSGCRPEEGRRFPSSLDCIRNLDHITLWVIDIRTGEVCDKKTYKNDYVYLTNHAGVHLHQDLLGVTSVQNQCVYILKLENSGKLTPVNTIGYFTHEDDEATIALQSEAEEKLQRQIAVERVRQQAEKAAGQDRWTPSRHGPTSSHSHSHHHYQHHPYNLRHHHSRNLHQPRQPHLHPYANAPHPDYRQTRTLAAGPVSRRDEYAGSTNPTDRNLSATVGASMPTTHGGGNLLSPIYRDWDPTRPSPFGQQQQQSMQQQWQLAQPQIHSRPVLLPSPHLRPPLYHRQHQQQHPPPPPHHAFGSHDPNYSTRPPASRLFQLVGMRRENDSGFQVPNSPIPTVITPEATSGAMHAAATSSISTNAAATALAFHRPIRRAVFRPLSGTHHDHPTPLLHPADRDGRLVRERFTDDGIRHGAPVSAPAPPPVFVPAPAPIAASASESMWSRNFFQSDGGLPPSMTPNEASCPLSGIKHRIMAYLYRRAITSTLPDALNHFHLTYPYFSALVMWRMQFLDRGHILLKLGSIDNVSGQFNIDENMVLGVFENSSQELFDIFEQWGCFHGTSYSSSSAATEAGQFGESAGGNMNAETTMHPLQQLATLHCNNEYARQLARKHMYAVRKARNGGAAQAIRRVLSSLPINPQSFSTSAYFDHDLFSYDDKVLNSCDRIRPSLEFPCKFYCRLTGKLKFKLETNAMMNGHTRGEKTNVMYIFHPVDPFVITVQQVQGMVTVLNIHYANF
ncbi:hypothetical protein BASA83_005859 [Batrachochytrium salamandrivorans]|nr:hypothetical protein BASA83_005859 [Batrachochytrium salamandrivorans]